MSDPKTFAVALEQERSEVEQLKEIQAKMLRDLDAANARLRLLRTLVGDRLEEHGIPVKPEDVADVVRWARNPDAVRELLKHAVFAVSRYEGEAPRCVDCDAAPWETHQALLTVTGKVAISPAPRRCAVVTAWRALGDPRGAEDIERAHEEALREHARRTAPREIGFAQATDYGLGRGAVNRRVTVGGMSFTAAEDIELGEMVVLGPDGLARPAR